MFFLMWGIAAMFQWFVWAISLREPLENNEEPSVYTSSRDLPLVIDVPWYTRPLFGLPPIRRGKILMSGAEVQIACMLCAGIQGAWLRVTGWIGDLEMEWITRASMLAFIFPTLLVAQSRILIYLLARK
jgi:hypothetical protein